MASITCISHNYALQSLLCNLLPTAPRVLFATQAERIN